MMSPVLAAVPTPPPGLSDWLAVFGWLVGIVTGCVVLWRMLIGGAAKTEIAGQPIEVRAARDLVTKSDHEKELSEIKTELKRHAERRQEIYKLQTDQTAAVATLKSEVQGAKDDIRRVEGKVDDNTKLTSTINGQVGQINQSVHQLNASVTSFIRDQAKRK